MLENQFLQKILIAAREEETRRGVKIPYIYIVGDTYFFDLQEVEGLEVDYTLVRSDMDQNFPVADCNTNNYFPKKRWDA